MNIQRSILNSLINSYHVNPHDNAVNSQSFNLDGVFTNPFHLIVLNEIRAFERNNYVVDQTTIEYSLFEAKKTGKGYENEWVAILSSSCGGLHFVKTYLNMLKHERKNKIFDL